ncbi:MAG: PhoH family protein [Gemmataceae bacterium]
MSDNVETTHTITLQGRDEAVALFGNRDANLRLLRESLGVVVVARGDIIQLAGPSEAVERATEVINKLRQILSRQGSVSVEDTRSVVGGGEGSTDRAQTSNLPVMEGGRICRARTEGQKHYVAALNSHDLVFCIGPAGSGKTYLAVAMAVTLLRQKSIRRIVLVRPAVEAGESLGFLPGDMAAKINPYLRPLLDALADFLEPDQLKRYTEYDIIEILALAYMRGRTLNNAIIILDEAQNATVSQMKMFLTRMGNNSKIIITGDVTQVDLPRQTRSGLLDAVERLKTVEGIAVVYLNEKDIVRHPLVQRIVRAYEETEEQP